MHETLEDEVRRIVASMDEKQNNQEQEQPEATEQETEPAETIHIHYFPDAIVIVKEDAETPRPDNVVDTTLAQTKKPPFFIAYAIGLFYLFLIISCIAFQFYLILNPPIATITIIPKSQTVNLTGTLQLGRIVSPLTISQSLTVPTTGKGHQPARNATGFITFYNGQLNSVTVPAWTILTASNGAQVITEQDAYIPAESQTIPPTLGHTTVSAHALAPGTRGNIQTGDINQGCCASSVLAQNTTSFQGGQDERNFPTVSKNDISSVVTPLKTTVMQSMQGALQGQVQPPEQLYMLPCSPTVSSDHRVGEEAIQVQVTVSETCSAVAYDTQALQTRATQLLTTEGLKKLAGYSLFGEIRVSVQQVSVTSASHPLVFLSFQAHGTWIYGLSRKSQERIKELIAGKTKDQALHIIASMSGVEHAAIRFTGFGDTTRLPKTAGYIHVILFVV